MYSGQKLISCDKKYLGLDDELMKVFNVEDYGAIGNGRTDCTKSFYDALEAARMYDGEKIIQFSSGRYLISGILEAKNMENISIRGFGKSTILIQTNSKEGGIWLNHCRNASISGFSFEMVNLPYCEGIVLGTGDCFVDISVEGAFEDVFEKEWFLNYNQNFASVVRSIGSTHYHMQEVVWYKSFERLSSNKWRVHLLDDGNLQKCGIRAGDGIYFLSRGGSKSDCFKASFCKDVIIENLTSYAGCSISLGLRNNENIVVRNISTQEHLGRIISTNADGIHASGNRGSIEISGCGFEGMADDGINVFAQHYNILEVVDDNTLIMQKDFFGRPGDTLQIIDINEGRHVKGEAKIIGCDECKKGVKIKLKTPVKSMKAGLTTLRAVDGIELTALGDQAYIHEECGRLYIHDCYFGRFRGRGILCHSNCLIENNIFDNNSACSIDITKDCNWPEGPVPMNITIRKNKFVCGSNVPGQPLISVRWISDDGYLKHIRIEDNDFAGHIDSPVIFLENVNDVLISGNVFEENIPDEYKLQVEGKCRNLKAFL